MTDSPSWPPEGMVVVGDYAFQPPHVPTELELEQAEEFVFTNEAFAELEEAQRRRNIIRLAMAAASGHTLSEQEGSTMQNIVPVIGGGVVRMTVTRHEGSPVLTYSFL